MPDRLKLRHLLLLIGALCIVAIALGMTWDFLLGRMLPTYERSSFLLRPIDVMSERWAGIAGSLTLGVLLARRVAPHRPAPVVALTMTSILVAIPMLHFASLLPSWSLEHIAARTVIIPMMLITAFVAWLVSWLYTRRVGPDGWLHASVACTAPPLIGWTLIVVTRLVRHDLNALGFAWALAPALLPVAVALVAYEWLRPGRSALLGVPLTRPVLVGMALVAPAVIQTVRDVLDALFAPLTASADTAQTAWWLQAQVDTVNNAVAGALIVAAFAVVNRTTWRGRLGPASAFAGMWVAVVLVCWLTYQLSERPRVQVGALVWGPWGDAVPY